MALEYEFEQYLKKYANIYLSLRSHAIGIENISVLVQVTKAGNFEIDQSRNSIWGTTRKCNGSSALNIKY